MAEEGIEEILQELDTFVQDELKVLTYKWVARHYSIPANRAKRILFTYQERNREKVHAVFLVSGWTKQEPPSHVHQLVRADALSSYRESLADVTGSHVYSVAPAQAVNPDSLWQVTYQQSQQLLKEVLSGQPSASAEAFRSNSCSAVQFTAPPPTAAAGGAAAAAGASATAAAQAQQQKPQQPGQQQRAAPAQAAARSPVAAKEAPAAGKPDAPVAAAASRPQAGPDAAGPSTTAPGASPPRAPIPSPPKPAAAGGKAAGKAAAPAAKPSKTLSNMWSKAGTKPKAAAEPATTKAEPAAQEQQQAEELADAGDADEDAIHVTAGNGRGRKRRGAQIEDSDEEGEEAPEGGAAGEGTVQALPADVPPEPAAPAAEAKGKKAAPKAKAAGKAAAQKEDKGTAKRAKTAAAKQPEPEPMQEDVQPAQAPPDADMDDAVLGALEAAAPPPAAAQPPPQARPTGAGGRGRKVVKTYINDDGEEVTEEVYEEGPAPLQPQQQPAVAQPQAAAAAKGAAKPAAKAAAPAKGKGKAPAAGQKSMTSFFAKK